jgi:P-type Ca2+ transporter type 2C
VEGLATALHTSLSDGLNPTATGPTSLEGRKDYYGINALKTVPPKNFFILWFHALKDPIIIMLMVAALVSTILGVAIPEEREDSAYTEGIAIWVAVLIVSLVGAGNDWNKDRQFQKLNRQKDIIQVKVVRGGKQQLVANTDILVGDLMQLETGDKIIADGYTTEVHGLTLDEASLTGESDPVKKGPEKDPWVRSGTQVTEGSGRMIVTAVGEHSEWGKTMGLVIGEAQDTPLQEKLGVLAMAIGKVGLVMGILCFLVLTIRWIIDEGGFPWDKFSEGPLDFFIFGVTVVVVAVPEGLPLAVTISLAYSMGKMMKDNNFVRVLAACETMGGATAICSDKTGTLTENRMTVVEGQFFGVEYSEVPSADALPDAAREQIELNCALNAKAFLTEDEKTGAIGFVGNRTECALLLMLQKDWKVDYRTIREEYATKVVEVFGFTSERKMASVLVRIAAGTLRLYNKGAAEIVINRCTSAVGPDGTAKPLTPEEKQRYMDTVTAMASRGLRTLCLSYRDFAENDSSRPADFFDTPPEYDLTALCLVGIKDPVRKEVPEAVATCQSAGITVRMVTGDNIHTAMHIARECGILTDGIAIEGPDFRVMSEEEMMQKLPLIQVMARSAPKDKYIMVQILKKMGEVVAVTGDGTNDAPALKESDVGLAMGIAGTEVAKEAADIVILDDNFSSIVKSVLWGRSVFANIRKFLQFQLTINLVAMIVAFVAAVSTGETPLNVLQLLWVNLIMDSLAALALATEDPTPQLLKHRPNSRSEPLINGCMAKHILVQSVYQCFWLFLIFYGLPTLSEYSVQSACDYWPVSEAQYCCTDFIVGTSSATTQCFFANSTRNTYYEDIFAPSTVTPMCISFIDPLTNAPDGCTLTSPTKADYCANNNGTSTSSGCDAHTTAHQDYDDAEENYENEREDEQEKANSMVFNTFIFMQVFNEINSRKIRDEYNVFGGILNSWVFSSVLIITVGAQVIIMFFLGGIFKVTRLNGWEWLISIGIGAGSMVVSFLTRLISKVFFPSKEETVEEWKEKQKNRPAVQYREHFWEIMRPPKPKDKRSSVHMEVNSSGGFVAVDSQ